MAETHRVARVERELFQLVSKHLQHRLGEPLPAFVSVTAVEVTPDLKHAKVFFRLVGSEEDQVAAEGILSENRKGFQADVAKNLKLKFCPVLRFVYGRVDKMDPIDEMLAGLKKGSR
jgi:ribosome-binding factor A